jgi:hypothetical protein
MKTNIDFLYPMIVRRMRSVLAKGVGKINTFMFNNFVQRWTIYEVMWMHSVEPDGPQLTICHKCIACWIPKATKTHSDYVVLIAVPLQQ